MSEQPKEGLHLETLESRMMLSSVQVFASGTTGVEAFEVSINQVPEVSYTLSSTEQQVFSFETSQKISGDDLRIEFTNDLYDPANGIDRNLNIDKVVIDGVTYETENLATFSTGTWKPEDGIVEGFRQSETIHTGGYFQYSDQGATPSTSGSVLTIRARGHEGGENFRLLINGENQGVFSVSQEFQNFVVGFDSEITANDVRIEFVNDLFDEQAGIDRNLVVDFIDIDGDIFQTEDSSVFSTGTWLPADGIVSGFGRGDTLNSNGFFQYAQANEGSLITIQARGDEGGEQFRLIIDGQEQAVFNVTQEFQTFKFQSDSNVSPSDIRIEFINDQFAPEIGIDSNLVVDFITIDGKVLQTEDPSVFSTGTWRPEDGIVPGFRLSEVLNSDGFFQYGANNLIDTDGDGILDGDDLDDDNDGIADEAEANLGTDPLSADSDGDGLQDGTELGLTSGTPDSNGGPNPFIPDADPTTTTDPLIADTDGDGLTDGQEDLNLDGATQNSIGSTGTPGVGETDPTSADTDGDGLSDGDEVNNRGTSPVDTDTDDGGTPDGAEVGQGTNPVDNPLDDVIPDTDGDGRPDNIDTDDDNDGLSDDEEAGLGTDPLSSDSDGDGVQDGTELGRTTAPADSFGGPVSFRPDADPTTTTDPLGADTDGDGLTDGQEDPNFDGASPANIGGTGTSGSGETDPTVADTDGDGLSDGDEVNNIGSNPLDTDTDDGSVGDGAEVGQGTDPVSSPGDDILSDNDGDGIPDKFDTDDDNDGILDGDEANFGTNPLNGDTDGDGLQDGKEIGLTEAGPDSTGGPFSFSPDADPTTTTDPTNPDTDGDGLTDGEEDINLDGATANTIGGTGTGGSGETDPTVADTDGDGLSDGDEVNNIGSDPLDTDSDDGTVNDGNEVSQGTDPVNTPGDDGVGDTDGDGINDFLDTDDDNDGLTDSEEANLGTDPLAADSDGDGVQDGTELGVAEAGPDSTGGPNPFVADADPTSTTDPLNSDTDGDGLTDGQEDLNADGASPATIGGTGTNGIGETDPTVADTDGDGLSDGDEVNNIGSNPLDTDTDDGGTNDGDEVAQDSNPVNNPSDDDVEIFAPNLGGNVFNGFIWDKNDISFTTRSNPFNSDVLGESTSKIAGRTFVINDEPVAIGVSDNDSIFGDSIKGGRIVGFSEPFVGGESLRVGDDFENEYSYLVREAGTDRLINIYAVETEGDVIGFASDAPMQQGVVYTFVSRTSTDPRVPWSSLATSYIS